MPFDNLGKKHFTPEQVTQLDAALQLVFQSLQAMAENLTPKERSKYGKVGAQKELLIDKVKDYHQNQSGLERDF